MTAPRPRALLFDWDNTLIDSWPTIHAALNLTLTEYGLPPWTLEETRTRVRKSMRDGFPLLFGDRWQEAGAFFHAAYAAHHLETLTPMPGATGVLRALDEAGLFLGVVSNKKGAFLRAECRHLGWDGYLRSLVGAQDAARDKPAPEPVDMALADSGIGRGPLVWFVGDTDIDMECGVAAGCVPVLVREISPKAGEFGKNEPVFHVNNLQMLPKLVASM
ncbi:MAG: HAD family hydrolase [Hyphomicrobiales bacterium]|nr:HAD family hydrolase [Hyphomicrobiales bacterium]